MRERRHRSSRPRKDRLIQTRVPRDLEETLKKQAERRRLSVSHLIRNVLEDAFELVDGVITHVDDIVADSHDLGRQVRRDARNIARRAQAVGRRDEPAGLGEPEDLDGADAGEDEGIYDAEPAARPDATPEPSSARSQHRAAPADARGAGPARPAARTAEPAGATKPDREPATPRRNLDHILAWNPVTLNRAARCSGCDAPMQRGEPGHLGVSDTPGLPPEWLCELCLDELG